MSTPRTEGVNNILYPATNIEKLETDGPSVITQASGSTIYDENGQPLLDAVGGLWCVNVGYGKPLLAKALHDASLKLSYYHTFQGHSNAAQIKLANTLLAIAPASLNNVFFGTSGSDANDTLIKIAWQYHSLNGNPDKRKIIARKQAYHGTSISTASATGLGSFHREVPLPLDFVRHTETPFYYRDSRPGESEEAYSQRLIDGLESMIAGEGADTIAAFIVEPIMGAGGVITPPRQYFSLLQACLKRHNILFIVDEVVTGYGRTGSWFASEEYNLTPDMMATAKGLTSGYFPMSAAFVSHAIWQTLKAGSAKTGGFAHGYTYSGHPVGAEVALQNIKILRDDKLVDTAKSNGQYLHERLNEVLLSHANVGEIRGKGLLAGIQLVQDKPTKTFFKVEEQVAAKVVTEARKLGSVIRALPSVSTLALSPPLCITEKEIDKIVNDIHTALIRVFG